MLNRWIGILSAVLMVGANTTLALRDIVPHWLAGEPPDLSSVPLDTHGRLQTQLAIYRNGEQIGNTWIDYRVSGGRTSVQAITLLRPVKLLGSKRTPPVQLETSLTFRENNEGLDDLKMSLTGLGDARGEPLQLELRGGYITSGDFPCVWKLGEQQGAFILEPQATRAIGSLMQPYGRMPGLYVGRSWRIELVDLISVLSNFGAEFTAPRSILATVTGTEPIVYRDQTVEAFVVETDGMKAWVLPEGSVARQVIEAPLLGEIEVIDEPYDPDYRRRALTTNFLN
ncbi:MAG: hypothetical protein KDA32_02995 [Phycisphaerales bacterium]|nr:hypothetical protein [Phycisphaerales bacterium]